MFLYNLGQNSYMMKWCIFSTWVWLRMIYSLVYRYDLYDRYEISRSNGENIFERTITLFAFVTTIEVEVITRLSCVSFHV